MRRGNCHDLQAGRSRTTRWPAPNAPHVVAPVRNGVTVRRGKLTERAIGATQSAGSGDAEVARSKSAIPWGAVKPADYIVALRRDSNRIAIAAEGRLDRVVPSCPGWQVADLVWHVGIVHMFWQMVARGALSGPEAWSEPDRPDDDDLIAWFREGVDLCATCLDGLDPAARAWTWGRRNTVGFIQRRVAQETTVHCWDAITAMGRNEPVEQTLAADGVDEFLDEVLPGLSRDLSGPTQTICLRANDTTDQWTIRTGEGSSRLIQDCAQNDAAVTATASNLLLLLWGRHSPNQVELDGNMTALQRFLARADF